MNTETEAPRNFIREIIDKDLAAGKNNGQVQTRFPPEPNGYLHIGHAKSICLNFGIARDYNGVCTLRFDDTNPEKEDQEYIDAIKRDVAWLGFEWGDNLGHASDYFDFLYECAEKLIEKGKAYVDEQSAEDMRENRGTLTEPGRNSPYRDRSVEENLDLFRRMKAGEFEDGKMVLRAKIDMASPVMILRDPALYRIRHISHPHVGDKWCIYPMYDFTHCLSDAYEGVTHSLCTLEFEDNRSIYDWVIEQVGFDNPPRQYEFSRLNLEYAIMSKRYLNQLVTDGIVDGWDDPRMPTIGGMRRRGFTAASIRDFCQRIGVTKSANTVEMGVLENVIREDLNEIAPRAMAVVDPIKVVIENYPEDKVEEFDIPNHPGKPEMGSRKVPFSREIYIDRSDFMEDPPKKFFRLGPDREVRLRMAHFIKCNEVIKDSSGTVVELRCTYDTEAVDGKTADGRKVKGIIHWVSAKHGKNVTVRLYDRLFNVPNPLGEDKEFSELLNPDSLIQMSNAVVEPALADAEPGDHYQFERTGYFVADEKDSRPGAPVFNRTVTLRDTWAREKGKG